MTRNRVLWVLQGLLALVFLAAGAPKLVMSAADMTAPGPIQVPVALTRFIGVCEILGAVAMILPGATGIKPGLTPLAASLLVVIMIGATVINVVDGLAPVAIVTAILGALCAFVAYGRWRTGPPAVART